MASRSGTDPFAPPPPAGDELFAPPPASGDAALFAPPGEGELFAPPPGTESQSKSPDFLRPEDFQRIGQKYGVDPEELRTLAPYYGAKVEAGSMGEALAQGARGTAGFVGSGALLNIPQWAYKKLQSEPMRKALDEIQGIARDQSNILETAREFVTPGIGIPRKIASSVAGRLAGGAGLGAVAGAAGSQEGKELEGAREGAKYGLALGAGAEVLGAGLRAFGKAEAALKERVSRQAQADINLAGREIAQRTSQAERVLEDAILRGVEISPDRADTVVRLMSDEESLTRLMSDDLATKRVVKEVPELASDLGVERAKAVLHARDLAEQRALDFAEDISGTRPKGADDAREVISEYAARQGGADAVAERYRAFVEEQQRTRAIAEKGIGALRQPAFWERATNFISDAQFVLRGIDNAFSVGAEKTHHEINRNYNRLTYAKAAFQKELSGLHDQIQKAGLGSSTEKIVDALDGKVQPSSLTPQEMELAQTARKYLDNFLDFVNGSVRGADKSITPLSIPRRANYFPHQLKDTGELISLFEKRKADALAQASQVAGRPVTDFAQLSPDEFRKVIGPEGPARELIDGLMLYDNRDISSGADLSRRFKERLYSRNGRISMETKAKASLEREGKMPEWMMERDLFKALDRYTGNTLRHLYLRRPIDQLARISRTLDKAGAEVESKYVSNLTQDLLGIRRGTAAEAALQTNLKFRQKLDETISRYGKDSVRGMAATLVKAIPEFMTMLTRQVYPNYLGLSPRAVIQNSTQLITKTIPELGTTYGPVVALRAGLGALLNLPRNIRRLESLGLQPQAFTTRHREYLAEGLAASLPGRLAGRGLQKLSDAALVIYSRMDTLNRAVTLSIADTMTVDLLRGSRLAQGALRKMPPWLQKQAGEAIARKDIPVLHRTLVEYLNATTQYNYNRASLSEFGRVMGPLFSTFTKWPTATVGDAVQEMRDKGLLHGTIRNAEKYLLPLMLLQAFDTVILNEVEGEDPSDRQRLLFGRYGLSSAAPIGTAKSVVTGDFFTPPAVDAIVKGVIVPAMDRDTEKLAGGMHRALEGFTPGYVLYRFLTEDLPTFVSGYRPEN